MSNKVPSTNEFWFTGYLWWRYSFYLRVGEEVVRQDKPVGTIEVLKNVLVFGLKKRLETCKHKNVKDKEGNRDDIVIVFGRFFYQVGCMEKK